MSPKATPKAPALRTQRLSIALTEPEQAELDRYAASARQPVSSLVRMAVLAYVRNEANRTAAEAQGDARAAAALLRVVQHEIRASLDVLADARRTALDVLAQMSGPRDDLR